MVLSSTVLDTVSGVSVTISEGGAAQTLTVSDGDSFLFSGSGANPRKTVKLLSGTSATTITTLQQTVTALDDGTFAFAPIPIGYSGWPDTYYKVESEIT